MLKDDEVPVIEKALAVLPETFEVFGGVNIPRLKNDLNAMLDRKWEADQRKDTK